MSKNPDRRFFFRRVDKRSREDMTAYLREHFRYDTMRNWNRSTSYANNLKICHLGLDSGTIDKLFDLIQVSEFYDELQDLIQSFNVKHDYRWQAGWNGRSGGYLVLYQGGLEDSKYRSYCTNCGQKNYTSVAKTGKRCGVCNEEARVDFDRPLMQVVTFPGRGLDMGDDFEDWTLYELRERVELVQDFDRLCDDIVTRALEIAETRTVEERTVYIPTKELVLA